MKHASIITAILVLLACAGSVQAQEWTSEQLEVWNRVAECTGFAVGQNLDGLLDCVHDDFSGFLYGDPVPRGKDSFTALVPYFIENMKVAAHEMRPVAIIVRGDMAVVHYYGFTVYEGSMEISQDKWTDVLVREDGVWRWIADHGGDLPADGE